MKYIKKFTVLNTVNYEFDYHGSVLKFHQNGELWYSGVILSEEERVEIILKMQEFKHIFISEIEISDRFTGAREIIKQSTAFSSKIVLKIYKRTTTISCRDFVGSIKEFEDYIKNEPYLRFEYYKVLIKDIKNNILFIKKVDKQKTKTK